MQLLVKRPLATALLGALLVPVLAACGGGSASQPAPTTAAAAPTTAAAVEPTAAAAEPTAAPTTAAEPTTAAAEPTAAPTTAAAAAPTTASGAMSGATLPEVDPLAVTGNIVTAGSSTVFPLSQAMAQRFKDEGYTGDITIDSVGTGAGFERFCVAAETDIANASRAIKEEEVASCQEKGREPIEFRVGTDALAVVVSAENTFVQGLTFEQLAKIYNAEVKNWNEVDPSYPSQPIQLFSPGSDSGTYDYFVEVVLEDDDSKLQASGAQFSENDNVLVQGVEGSPNAIGYFGFAYLTEAAGKLRAVPLAEEGTDFVEPNETTAEDGTYPLSRPLFIYSDATILKEKPQVAAFINFYLSFVNEEVIDAGYFPASGEALDEAKQHLIDATQ